MRKRPVCPLPPSASDKSTESTPKYHPPAPMTLEEACKEAARCLSLSTCEGCEVCQLICPDQAISKDPDTGKPVIDYKYCKACGLCAHFCPKGAIEMVPD